MKTSFIKFINNPRWIVLLIAGIGACQQDNVTHEIPSVQPELTANDNIQIVATAQDVMDITEGALAGQGVTDEGSSSLGKLKGPEIECAPSISGTFDIDRSSQDSIVFQGTLTIDYGTGTFCKDSSEIKKGKITDSFIFVKRFHPASFSLTQSVSFQDFQKDSVQVDGSFVSTSSSSLISSLKIQDAKLTYADGTYVAWSGNLTTTIVRSEVDWFKDGFAKEVSGSISGTTRSGASFSSTITSPVSFKYSCSRHIPVSGSIHVVVGSDDSLIDYGDGNCDNVYTITMGGKTTEYKFKWNPKNGM